MKTFAQLKTYSALSLLLLLSACCGGFYDGETASLVASINQNSSGQGVAAWQQPAGNGIAIARFDASGVWSGIKRIGSGDATSSIIETQAIIASNGDQFILWRGREYYSGAPARYYLNHYVAAIDSWQDIGFPSAISSNPVNALHVEIGTDAVGNAWLLWVDGNQIWVAHFDTASGVWDIVSRLDNGTDTGQFASMAVNASGVAIVSWSTAIGNGLWASRYTGGSWQAQVSIANGLPGRPDHLRLAIDDAGNALLAWRLQVTDNLSAVYAATFNAGTGLWSASTRLDVDSFASGKLPSVSMRGIAGYVAWTENGQLWATRSLAGSATFDMPVSLASSVSSFALTSANDGRAYLGWHDSSAGTISVRTYLPMATGWSSFVAAPAMANEISGLLAASTDSDGNLVMLWERGDERRNPDPFVCRIYYEQVWYGRYDINQNAWTKISVLDTDRID